MKDLIGLCEACPKRKNCAELCKDAEIYANQDYVTEFEMITERPKAHDRRGVVIFNTSWIEDMCESDT